MLDVLFDSEMYFQALNTVLGTEQTCNFPFFLSFFFFFFNLKEVGIGEKEIMKVEEALEKNKQAHF